MGPGHLESLTFPESSGEWSHHWNGLGENRKVDRSSLPESCHEWEQRNGKIFFQVLCLQAQGNAQMEREKFMMWKRGGAHLEENPLSEREQGASRGFSGGLASDNAETLCF